MLTFTKESDKFGRDVLTIMKKGSGCSKEMLKFVKINNRKCYDNSQKTIIKRHGFFEGRFNQTLCFAIVVL